MWEGLLYHDFMGTCSARMVAISSAASSASCPDVIVAAVGMVDAVGGVVCFGVEREVAAEACTDGLNENGVMWVLWAEKGDNTIIVVVIGGHNLSPGSLVPAFSPQRGPSSFFGGGFSLSGVKWLG